MSVSPKVQIWGNLLPPRTRKTGMSPMRLGQNLPPRDTAAVKAHYRKSIPCGQKDDGISDLGGGLTFQIDLPRKSPGGSQAPPQPRDRDGWNNYPSDERLYLSFSGSQPGVWWLAGAQP